MTKGRQHVIYVHAAWLDEGVGQSSHARGFIPALLRQTDVDVSVIVPRRSFRGTGGRAFEDERVRYLPLPDRKLHWYVLYQGLLLVALVRAVVRARNPVLFVRFSPTMVAPTVVSWMFRVPVVVRTGPTYDMFEERPIPQPFRALLERNCRSLIARAMNVIAVTNATKDGLVAHHSMDPRKVVVIPNGVDETLFRPGAGRTDLGVLHHFDRIVGYVGSLGKQQGVDLFVEAAPLVVASGRSVGFLVVGGGGLFESLRERVDELGLAEHFLFTGFVRYEDVPSFTNSCHITVVPFPRSSMDRGSSAMKLYEYFGCGKFVVASRQPDHEFIERNRIGLMHEPDDPVDFAEKLIDAISTSDEELQHVSERARRYVEENHTWDRLVEVTLETCLQRPRRRETPSAAT